MQCYAEAITVKLTRKEAEELLSKIKAFAALPSSENTTLATFSKLLETSLTTATTATAK